MSKSTQGQNLYDERQNIQPRREGGRSSKRKTHHKKTKSFFFLLCMLAKAMKISVISLCFVKVGRLMALWLSDEGAYSLSLVDRFIAVIAKGCKCLFILMQTFSLVDYIPSYFMLRLKCAVYAIKFSVGVKTIGNNLFHHEVTTKTPMFSAV